MHLSQAEKRFLNIFVSCLVGTPPTNITMALRTNKALTINWVEPPHSTVTVSKYQITLTPGDKTQIVEAPANSAEVTGLTPLTDYKIVIASMNQGTDQYGANSNPEAGPFKTLPSGKLTFHPLYRLTTVTNS